MAAGLLTKGPVALVPVVVLVAWLILGGRRTHLRRLHLVIGPALATIPIAAWAASVALLHPGAIELWRHEIVDRATGSGDHSEPIWYFVPVVLVGCFPATGMLTLPLFNTSWRAAWNHLRSGTPAALMTLSILVPLLIFSLNAGKLPTYVLPLAPPLAQVGAITLERWLGDRPTDRPFLHRQPDVRWTIGFVLLLISPVAFVAATWFLPESGHLPALLLLPMAAAMLAMAVWSRGARWREVALGVLFATWMAAVVTGMELEDAIRARSDPRRLLSEAAMPEGSRAAGLLMFGLRDGTLAYYAAAGQEIASTDDPSTAEARSRPWMMLAEEQAWRSYAQNEPERASHFDVVASGTLWPRRRVLMLRTTVQEESLDDAGTTRRLESGGSTGPR